jgi:hypothetical protein
MIASISRFIDVARHALSVSIFLVLTNTYHSDDTYEYIKRSRNNTEAHRYVCLQTRDICTHSI